MRGLQHTGTCNEIFLAYQKVYDILNKRFCDIYQSERFAKYHEVYKTIHWLANVPKVLHNDTQSSLKHTKRSVKCYPIYVQNMNKLWSQFHSPKNISEIELTKKHLNYNQHGEGKMHMWNAIKIDETTEKSKYDTCECFNKCWISNFLVACFRQFECPQPKS